MKRYLSLAVLAAPASAFAAVPANVSTALGDALTDATTVAGLALIIVVAVAAFKYMKSAVR
jgi:small basic protein